MRKIAKGLIVLLIFSAGMSGCAFADSDTNSTEEVLPADDHLSNLTAEERAKLEADRQADQARLAAERQAMLEASLMHEIGERPLQFKALLAQLYGDNHYDALWTDKAAEKRFLRDYAALVASGISPRSALSLEAISSAETEGGLVYDVLLTDAFLDYLYYSTNVAQKAQAWLYARHAYKPKQPEIEIVERWLDAVKNNENNNFIYSLSTNNSFYLQTLQVLPEMISETGLSDIGKKLALNIQRLRVIPDFYNGIFVNIPSYQLNYYRDGELALESRVIVGKGTRRTPVMYSKLSNVVVNPPWNAPPRLVNEDIVPKLRQDPGYAAAHNYAILDSKGNQIDPYSIDWDTIGKRFPYRIRQAAGDSALGHYKFNMPSSDAIYLHDTPNRGLFNKKGRALSSGCVRVEKSDQLASILLGEAGWSNEKRRNVVSSKRTTSVPIQSDNPVFLYYVTAWIDNGELHTLPDIYNYDVSSDTAHIDWRLIKKYL